MLNWLKSLFASKPKAYVRIPRHDQQGGSESGESAGSQAAADAIKAAHKQAEAEKWRRDGIGNLDDHARRRGPVEKAESELIERIGQRIEQGNFDLPQLPATQLAAMNMAGDPNCEIDSVVQLISTDPVLSSELLRIANSSIYSKDEPVETLHQAVMRLGTRVLRSMIYTVSIRGSVVGVKGLKRYSEEIWRQAFMVGHIAKALAPKLRMEPEKAFLLGLLHDVGKIVLLSLLKGENLKTKDVAPSTMGLIFVKYHERAGAMMAESWKLSPEISGVIACHHDFAANAEYSQAAALVSLAHRMDLHLSTADEDSFLDLLHSEEMEHLGIAAAERNELLTRGRAAYMQEYQSNRKVA